VVAVTTAGLVMAGERRILGAFPEGIMSIDYTPSDLERWLLADAVHGLELAFVLQSMHDLGYSFVVSELGEQYFNVAHSGNKIRVDPGAKDPEQAAEWALDALREWACAGTNENGSNYFGQIARAWASSGDRKRNTAKSIGDTMNWLLLFTSYGCKRKGKVGDLLPVHQRNRMDYFDLFCWVYADLWNPMGGHNHAKVNIEGSPGFGPPGLNPSFWDSDPGRGHTDQAHHFAAFFWFGANLGAHPIVLKPALIRSGDLRRQTDWTGPPQETITNQGDYRLGVMAARVGNHFSKRPGYIGKDVERALLIGDMWDAH
jgi:hypothetical protein